jgi:hypothetical protein
MRLSSVPEVVQLWWLLREQHWLHVSDDFTQANDGGYLAFKVKCAVLAKPMKTVDSIQVRLTSVPEVVVALQWPLREQHRLHLRAVGMGDIRWHGPLQHLLG